jgi:hypothetical protein
MQNKRIICDPLRGAREDDRRFRELVECRRQEWRAAHGFRKLVVYAKVHVWAWRELQKHRPPSTVE